MASNTAVAKASQVCSTPEPQKATVFNVAEYKKALAAKQQQAAPQSPPAKKEVKQEQKAVAVVDLTHVGPPLMKVEAKYDFNGNAAKQEMSFQKGDYITVYGQSSVEGWWVGRLQGDKTTALFPYNYVKLVKKFA